MHPLPLPGSFFFIIIITFVLIHAPKFASSANERYVNCNRTFACGNIGNIGYPFWGSDRPEYCGYPGFQLNCSDSTQEITIGSATYHVLEINNESRVLTVARADYLDDLCPPSLINTTLNPDLFEFTPDAQVINLYYDCLLPPPPPPTPLTPTPIPNPETDEYFNHFTCNGYRNTCGYYLTRNLSELPPPAHIAISGFLGTCGDRVVLVANKSTIQSLVTSQSLSEETLVDALENGFGLQWNANNSLCDQCRGSGGLCGYNNVSNKFSCYCTDRPHEAICPTGQFVTSLYSDQPHSKVICLSY
ncbi:hypothetical protein SLA2020_378670 [Shorea laevis]